MEANRRLPAETIPLVVEESKTQEPRQHARWPDLADLATSHAIVVHGF